MNHQPHCPVPRAQAVGESAVCRCTVNCVDEDFVESMREMRDRIYHWAIGKGWYDCHDCQGSGICMSCTVQKINGNDVRVKRRNIPEQLMLCVSELSEALEHFREGKMDIFTSMNDGKPDGFPIELADCMIRLFDLCGHLKIDIGEAVLQKMDYNQKRPHRHGNKAC